MSSFEQLRNRLPSLYRPDEDDLGGQIVSLAAEDIVALNGKTPPPGAHVDPGGAFIVTLDAPMAVRQVRLAPGRAPGSGYALAFYRLDGGYMPSLPSAVTQIRDNVATLADEFRAANFVLRLWRGSLLTRLLSALGREFDELDLLTADVLKAHWFEYADRALHSAFWRRDLQLRDPVHFPPQPNDPGIASELRSFPYICDLARLAAQIPLLPWHEPADQREAVEAYRERIRAMIALYRNGLGTVGALRRRVAAELPPDLAAPADRQERAFAIEEYAPLVRVVVPVTFLPPVQPAGMVGPLMRWQLTNDSLAAVVPTVYIQGVTPEENVIDPTGLPVIELYATGKQRPRLSIAYRGTIESGQTLRLRPSYTSWVVSGGTLLSARSEPTEKTPADPTAPGPWTRAWGHPIENPRIVFQAGDKTLWVAADAGGPAGTLWRFNGQDWTQAVKKVPRVNCLAEHGQELLAGTERGLCRVPLYPPTGQFKPVPALNALQGPAVYALYQAANGAWWAGTAEGAARLHVANEGPASLSPSPLHGTAVHAISQDHTGALYFGADLGVFQYQPEADCWYWYAGGERTEQAADWRPGALSAGNVVLPGDEQVFLPRVLAVYRGPDASLWLGTEKGLARYVARPLDGLAYDTVLEAFPDLADGPVTAIYEDERGQIWFCTDRGLLRFDGRDLFQFTSDVWAPLGRADRLYKVDQEPQERGSWRYVRGIGQWQRFEGRTWVGFTGTPRMAAEPAARAVCWTDSVVGDLGQWDGSQFTPLPASPDTPTAIPGALGVRCKSSEDRIVDGGLPAVPRVPVGKSLWRYLTLEPPQIPEPPQRPFWTPEGRLLPPPDQSPAIPGRYDLGVFGPAAELGLEDSIFAYLPAARVWFAWEARQPLTVLVRLKQRTAGERIDPIILDRVWQGIQQVRPAGVRAMLATEEELVRG
jgi:hypothetical protein